MQVIQFKPQPFARTAGIFYLMIILLGIVGQLVIRGSLVVPNDLTATVQNISSSPFLWRIGIFCDIAMQILDIPVMVVIYMLLKPVDANLALVALVFNLMQTAVLVVNKLALVLPLIVLESPEYVGSFDSSQIESQVALFANLYNYGLGLGLIFFGISCLFYGYLIFKSVYFPKFLGG